jgi:DNA polymerase-3 subunit alpha
MFCAAHAFSMACDSLYVAWLKVHYPYELYLTMLKLWDEKHKRDKIAAIISEMKRYKNISLTVGRFGQDNRDWLVDKEAGTISQSISSISYMSKQVAKDLYIAGQKTYESFTEVLRELQMNTCLNTRQIKILIELGYFERFGKSAKLMAVFDEFFDGENKLTKTVKSYEARLKACAKYESTVEDKDLPIGLRLGSELENVGLCLSTEKNCPGNLYFVRETDTKYGVKAVLYSVQRGTVGLIRIRKNIYADRPFEPGDCIKLTRYNKSPKYIYKGGERNVLPGEMDIWAEQYEVFSSRK